ncbi:MAG TPA: hypothetical protein VKY73_22405 [Polyangiaceae bacterium]|nr:hypothetical protein [Polyangiaceae bacterium]
MDNDWGHCQHCKFFDSPARIPLPTEEARCRHPELSKYKLVVFGASGCSGFQLRPGLQPEVEQPQERIIEAGAS